MVIKHRYFRTFYLGSPECMALMYLWVVRVALSLSASTTGKPSSLYNVCTFLRTSTSTIFNGAMYYRMTPSAINSVAIRSLGFCRPCTVSECCAWIVQMALAQGVRSETCAAPRLPSDSHLLLSFRAHATLCTSRSHHTSPSLRFYIIADPSEWNRMRVQAHAVRAWVYRGETRQTTVVVLMHALRSTRVSARRTDVAVKLQPVESNLFILSALHSPVYLKRAGAFSGTTAGPHYGNGSRC
jgi:hypothetical protein